MLSFRSLQKWWSYIRDIHIESRSSEHNAELHVVLSEGRYQLITSEAIYSHEDLYHNFSLLLTDHLDIDDRPISKVLILGLGMGSIPLILDKIKPGKWQITAIEIDEEVCDLAHIYCYPNLTSEIQTIITDAAVYVDVCSDSFDMICVDLFIGDQTPDIFKSQSFLSQLSLLLSDHGLVIYNTLGLTEAHNEDAAEFFKNKFSHTFPEAQSIHVYRNNMLISHGDWLRG